jgi:hypothetical protein
VIEARPGNAIYSFSGEHAMASKLIIAPIRAKKAAKSGLKRAAKLAKVGGVYRLDANAPGFDERFAQVFKRNVSKARRENKRLLGSVDFAPKAR